MVQLTIDIEEKEMENLLSIAIDNNTTVEWLIELILRVETENDYEGLRKYFNP